MRCKEYMNVDLILIWILLSSLVLVCYNRDAAHSASETLHDVSL